LFLNYRESYQVPIDAKFRLFVRARPCKVYFRDRPAIDGPATDCELFFEHAKLFESLRKLKGNREFLDLDANSDLNFNSHWYIRASSSEILRLNQIADVIGTSGAHA
jgi:hypothetical protein